MEENTIEREYIAFISYRHMPLDQEAAEIVQKKIEHFKVPKEFRKKTGGSRLGVVFRDEDELPVSSSLSSSIIYALDHSQFLIVICTPDLPKSKWCETEIRYFIEKHGRNRVIAVLADGTPEESFPEYLRYEYDESGQRTEEVEPLAANISGKDHSIDRSRLKKETVRIYAALLGCPFDELWQRQRRYRTRRLLLLAAVLFCAMAVFMAVVISKNVQITAQNRELMLQKSYLLTDAGEMMLENSEIESARENAVMALQNEEGMPYDLKAERLLAEVNGAYQYQGLRSEKLYEQKSEILDILFAGQSEKIFISDEFGMVRCIDPYNGQTLWECTSLKPDEKNDATGETTKLVISNDEQILYMLSNRNLKAVDAKTGKKIWEHPMYWSTSCHGYDKNAEKIWVIEGEQDETIVNRYNFLTILDSADGQEILKISVDEEENGKKWEAAPLSPFDLLAGGRFSENQQYFGLVFFQDIPDNETEEERACAWIIETATGKVVFKRTWEVSGYMSYEIHGVYVDDEGKNLFVSFYNGGEFGIETRMINVDSEEEIRTFYEWTPSYVPVIGSPGVSDTLPLLMSDHLAVTVIEDQIYINRMPDGNRRGRWMVDGNVVGLDWVDRENQILWAVTDKGKMYHLKLAHEGEYTIEETTTFTLGQNETIRKAGMVDGRQFVFLTGENRGNVMVFRTVNDQNYERLIEKNKLVSNGPAVLLSPSGEHMFVADATYGEPITLYTFDTRTMEMTGTAVFEDIPWTYDIEQVSAFSEDAVLYTFWILHSDGTVTYPESMSQEFYDEDSAITDSAESILTKDGTNMAVSFILQFLFGDELNPESEYMFYDLGRCWINGVKNEIRLKILETVPGTYWLGRNGLFVAYGQRVEVEDGLIATENDNDAFLVWNMKDESYLMMEDAYPESGNRILITGNDTPVFAVADSDGCIRVYDAGNNECSILTDAYTTGAVLAMTFMDEDRYLAVESYTGTIDIYRRTDGEIVCTIDEDLTTYASMAMESYDLDDGRIMLVAKESDRFYGDAVVIDLEEFEVTTVIGGVCFYIPGIDKIVVRRNLGDIGAFPYYDKDELIGMAAEKQ